MRKVNWAKCTEKWTNHLATPFVMLFNYKVVFARVQLVKGEVSCLNFVVTLIVVRST